MRAFVKFTVLRLGLFVAALAALYALQLRGVLLAGLAAVISVALSYVLLRGPREELAQVIAARAAGRTGVGPADDDAAEDAEVDRLSRRPPDDAP